MVALRRLGTAVNLLFSSQRKKVKFNLCLREAQVRSIHVYRTTKDYKGTEDYKLLYVVKFCNEAWKFIENDMIVYLLDPCAQLPRSCGFSAVIYSNLSSPWFLKQLSLISELVSSSTTWLQARFCIHPFSYCARPGYARTKITKSARFGKSHKNFIL